MLFVLMYYEAFAFLYNSIQYATEYYKIMTFLQANNINNTLISYMECIVFFTLIFFIVSYIPNKIAKIITQKYDEYLIANDFIEISFLTDVQYHYFKQVYNNMEILNNIISTKYEVHIATISNSQICVFYNNRPLGANIEQDVNNEGIAKILGFPDANAVFSEDKINFAYYDEYIEKCIENRNKYIKKLQEKWGR